MHGRLVASFLAAGILLVSTASAGTTPLQDRAYEVRSAIPAAIAYYADHGTWRGVTFSKLRRYDSSIKNIVVRHATKTGFCLQSTKTPFAHYDGPAGKVRKGRCGVRGAVIPFVARPGSTPPPFTTAEQRLRAAVPAMEAYAADHNGYAGMTIAELRKYDTRIIDITIVRATRDTYCVESGTGVDQFHRNGPAEPNSPGPCPAS